MFNQGELDALEYHAKVSLSTVGPGVAGADFGRAHRAGRAASSAVPAAGPAGGKVTAPSPG